MDKLDKNKRQRWLLQVIVHEYVQSAQPVSSKRLVEKYGVDYSSATVRNDMAELEEKGLIMQPHTSAGRVPTEKGYHYYIRHFLHQVELKPEFKETLNECLHDQSSKEVAAKKLAKTVADFTSEAVVMVDANDNLYYTGISHIFRQPEFSEAKLMLEMSAALDQMEEVMTGMMQNIIKQTRRDTQILIGDENPLARDCAMIVSPFNDLFSEADREHSNSSRARGQDKGEPQDDHLKLLGIFGPMRMDYNTNLAIMEYMEQLINDDHEHEHSW